MATISTVKKGSDQPESALVAFVENDNFELIFETFVDTRKWRNLQDNPRVAFVIGWDLNEHITVQYEGIATPVESSAQEAAIQYFLQKDTPCTEKFLRDYRVRLFKVSPHWVRYSDYTKEMPKIIEIDFKSKSTY